ncbi:MAG: hypothetical protein J1D77_06245 [Muribaculaceae bacterium]|nr:hypothetical protein [Muribaculaceae bacterium]
MATLFAFNPEHDLALAADSIAFTPPAAVGLLKKSLSLLPAIYAANGDFILVGEDFQSGNINSLPYQELVKSKKLSVVKLSELPKQKGNISKIIPWGWNKTITNELSNAGISPLLLPTDQQLSNIRRLSHRLTAIRLREFLAKSDEKLSLKMPKELFDLQDLEDFLKLHSHSFFKAPWSSSGRGIVCSSHISPKGLMEWAHGVIKKQGSLIAEPAWEKSLDFATEWWISKGEAKFIGFSVFKASSRGKYHGNIEGTQEKLKEIIKTDCPGFDPSLIELQRLGLNAILGTDYSGPLGIDMLSDSEGNVNPCVEINLRLTMGFINIPEGRKILQESNSIFQS